MIFSKRNDIKLIARVALSAMLIAWLLSNSEINHIINNWQGINWLLLAVVIPMIHLISIGLRSIRLSTILNNFGLGVSLIWLILIQLKGIFLGSILPGGISGDIYRTFIIAKKTTRAYESISAIFFEKIVSINLMLLSSLFCILYGIYWLEHPVFETLFRSVLLISVCLSVLCMTVGALVYTGLIDRIQGSSKVWIKFKGILKPISYFRPKSMVALKVIIISLLIQTIVVVWYFTLSKAIRFDLSFLVFMVAAPIIELLLMLPISIGGIGVREGAFVILFTPFGLSAGDAISFSLLSFAVTTIMRMLSGAVFLFEFERRVDKAKSEPQGNGQLLGDIQAAGK